MTYDPDNRSRSVRAIHFTGNRVHPGTGAVPRVTTTSLLSFRSSARYRWCASGVDRMEKDWRPEWCTSGHGRGARAARESLTPRRCESFLTLRRNEGCQDALSSVEYAPVWSSPKAPGRSQSSNSLIANWKDYRHYGYSRYRATALCLCQFWMKPHWRVNFRPKEYDPELIPTPTECFRLVEQTSVRFPGMAVSVSQQPAGRAAQVYKRCGVMGTDNEYATEYWRFYQSGQFLHLFTL